MYDSDIFIHLPAYDEGFGITVIEALATGLVCITNDRGAMKELISDGYNGFVLQTKCCNNAQILTDIIRKVMQNNLFDIKRNAVTSSKKFSITNTINVIKNNVK